MAPLKLKKVVDSVVNQEIVILEKWYCRVSDEEEDERSDRPTDREANDCNAQLDIFRVSL